MTPKAALSWRWLTLVSVLLIGGSLGVLLERLVLAAPTETEVEESVGELWFDCTRQPTERSEEEQAIRHRQHLADIRQALSLDQQQVDQVDEILQSYRGDSLGFWVDTRESYCSRLSSLRQEVRELLRPEQLPPFEARIRRIDEKMKRQHQRVRRENAEDAAGKRSR